MIAQIFSTRRKTPHTVSDDEKVPQDPSLKNAPKANGKMPAPDPDSGIFALDHLMEEVEKFKSSVENCIKSLVNFEESWPSDAAAEIWGSDLSQTLTKLEQCVEDQVCRLVLATSQPLRPDGSAFVSEFDTRFAQLEKQLETLAARPMPVPDMTDQQNQIAEIMAAIGAVVRSNDTLQQQIETLPDALPSAPSIDIADITSSFDNRFDQFDNRFAQLESQLETLAARPTPVPDMTDHQNQIAEIMTEIGAVVRSNDTLKQRIENLQNALPSAPSIDVADITSSFDNRFAQFDNRFAQLESQLETLAARPTPVPDMTVQHRQMAQIMTAIGVVGRGNDKLQEKIESLTATPPFDIDAITTSFDNKFAMLESQLESLTARPVPAPDMTAQQRQMGQIMSAIGAVGRGNDTLQKTIENLPAVLPLAPPIDIEAITASISELEAQLQNLAARPMPVPDMTVQENQIAEIMTAIGHGNETLQRQLDNLSAAQPDAPSFDINAIASSLDGRFAQLESQLETLTARPMPVPDMTVQHRQMAHIMTAIGVIGRANNALQHQVKNMPAALPSAPPVNIDEITSSFDSRFAQLESRLETLTARPTPVPDMTVHHRQMAQIMTAISAIGQRHDKAISGLETSFSAMEASAVADPMDMDMDTLAAKIQQAVHDAWSMAVPHQLPTQSDEAANRLRPMQFALAELMADQARQKADSA